MRWLGTDDGRGFDAARGEKMSSCTHKQITCWISQHDQHQVNSQAEPQSAKATYVKFLEAVRSDRKKLRLEGLVELVAARRRAFLLLGVRFEHDVRVDERHVNQHEEDCSVVLIERE